MESRSRTSPEQFAALLEFMESRGDIARPQQGAQGRLKSDRLWQELAGLLSSIGGGVKRPTEKWKKVWADWKAKTKKKALAIRLEAYGTGGGPSRRQFLTDPEQRVLAIMGLTAVVGQHGIEERGFDDASSARSSLPPPIRNSITEFSSQISANVIELDLPRNEGSTTAPSSLVTVEVQHEPVIQMTPSPLDLASVQMSATSPVATTSQRQAQRRQRPATPLPVPSPTTSTPRRRRLIRARTRRVQTPFERATNAFVAVEEHRLELEADRERNTHEREMERLRLESRRIDMEENRDQTLRRLAVVVNSLSEILPQLKPSSLPSTDIL